MPSRGGYGEFKEWSKTLDTAESEDAEFGRKAVWCGSWTGWARTASGDSAIVEIGGVIGQGVA